MNRHTSRWAAAGLALAAFAAAGPLAAQADSGRTQADSMRPAAGAPAATPSAVTKAEATPVPTSQLAPPTGVPGYLLSHARALNLTPKQLDRVRKVQDWLKGADSTARAQWQQLTGGRPVRSIPPAERRRLGPELQPIMQQLHANNAAALDSVDAILTPRQQQRLQAALQEYRQRMQRRAHPGAQAPAQPAPAQQPTAPPPAHP